VEGAGPGDRGSVYVAHVQQLQPANVSCEALQTIHPDGPNKRRKLAPASNQPHSLEFHSDAAPIATVKDEIDPGAQVDPEALLNHTTTHHSLSAPVLLLSLMAANNEHFPEIKREAHPDTGIDLQPLLNDNKSRRSQVTSGTTSPAVTTYGSRRGRYHPHATEAEDDGPA